MLVLNLTKDRFYKEKKLTHVVRITTTGREIERYKIRLHVILPFSFCINHRYSKMLKTAILDYCFFMLKWRFDFTIIKNSDHYKSGQK